jgi:hypothetical protein
MDAVGPAVRQNQALGIRVADRSRNSRSAQLAAGTTSEMLSMRGGLPDR